MEFDYGEPEEEMKSYSPWKRNRPESSSPSRILRSSLCERFDDFVDDNIDLDIYTKRAALKASPSVVNIVSLTGGKFFFMGSGVIVDSENVNGTYTSSILTSATVLRSTEVDDAVEDDIKIYVHLEDGKFEGQVLTYDFHYNIAAIRIESDALLPTATLRLLDDSISIDPSEVGSPGDMRMGFQLRPHSDLFNICPGDKVVAVGRWCKKPYKVMAAPGKFSLDCCKFDCKELFKANCLISKCGTGGPLVNIHGEVIGINFYDTLCTPFLPINIASKCWEHFKRYRKFCRPMLGMQLTNLYASSVDKLEGFIQMFPGVFKGVVVEKVITGSPADAVGMRHYDVIVECDGNLVRGFLELYGMIFDKVGESVEVVVMRTSTGERLTLTFDVRETRPDEFNRWPLPKEYRQFVKAIRRR